MAWWLANIAAVYPAVVTLLLVALPVVQPRTGPFALAAILAMHVALAGILLLPLAFVRDARALRLALVALAVMSVVRFGDEWVSLPMAHATDAADLRVLSWNLEFGARPGDAAVEGLRGLDVDVVALQELGADHAAAIEADADVGRRFPFYELRPRDGVLGMGLLSAYPIQRTDVGTDPVSIEAVIDVDGRAVTVITGHPFPGHIGMAGPLPMSFDATSRDAALERFRARVDAAIARGETVIVVGDFNTAPTEPAFDRVVAGLVDAHRAVGIGPGWTWRPSRFEPLGIGLLRIDLALSGPGATPTGISERCDLPGDHCQLHAGFALAGP